MWIEIPCAGYVLPVDSCMCTVCLVAFRYVSPGGDVLPCAGCGDAARRSIYDIMLGAYN